MSFASQLAATFAPIAAVYDQPSIDASLSWAQGFIETYCDATFDVVTNDVVYVDAKPYRTALLPFVPVVSVTMVEGFLPSTNSGSYAWTQLVNFAFTYDTGLIYDTTGQDGAEFTLGPTWPWTPRGLRVTYTHGPSVVPQALVDTGCRLAQQYLENPASTMERRVGDTSSRFSGSKGVALGPLDAVVLGRYMNIGIG